MMYWESGRSAHLGCWNPMCKHQHFECLKKSDGPGSVVGIVTAYGLDGLGFKSWWGRDFPHLSRPALRPNQPPVQ
jgi:hypothetical protein